MSLMFRFISIALMGQQLSGDAKERKVSNVYCYPNGNVWGVKVNGKEVFAVPSSISSHLLVVFLKVD